MIEYFIDLKMAGDHRAMEAVVRQFPGIPYSIHPARVPISGLDVMIVPLIQLPAGQGAPDTPHGGEHVTRKERFQQAADRLQQLAPTLAARDLKQYDARLRIGVVYDGEGGYGWHIHSVLLQAACAANIGIELATASRHLWERHPDLRRTFPMQNLSIDD